MKGIRRWRNRGRERPPWKQKISVVICVGMLILYVPFPVRATENILTLEQAQRLVLLDCDEYKEVENELNMQRAEYADAVKSVWLKQKNVSTYRWSPLLSFQFPESPGLADSYTWQYKPIQIQNEITSLQNKLNDVKYEVLEETAILYVNAYVLQEKLNFNEEYQEKLEDTIQRYEWRRKLGEISQSEMEKLYTANESLTDDISRMYREAEAAQKKLEERIGLDAGEIYGVAEYRLENPLLSAEIERSALEGLTEYTLENNQEYYEAQLDTRLGLMSLELNEKLMKKQYGSKMQEIQTFINQAKQGQELDENAFMTAYERFLEEIEEPWDGSVKILSLEIPKEWFKGSQDGVRYIEDDPYVLYTAALEYSKLLVTEENVRNEVGGRVADEFEMLISAGNTYRSLEKSARESQALLEKDKIRNQLGAVTSDELQAEQEDCEKLQTEVIDALAEYCTLLFSFDRLTCGGLSRYLKGEELSAASVGMGIANGDGQEASYYIQSIIEEQMFQFGIFVPDDFTPEITGYELWVNGEQIGERTPKDEAIRHLTLALDGINSAKVRLYSGEELAAECEIETMVSSAPLFK